MYVYIYIYVLCVSLSLSLYIYITIHVIVRYTIIWHDLYTTIYYIDGLSVLSWKHLKAAALSP